MNTRIRTFALKFLLEHQQELQSDTAYAHDLAETLIPDDDRNPAFTTAARDLVMQVVLHLTAGGTNVLCLADLEAVLRQQGMAVASFAGETPYLDEGRTVGGGAERKGDCDEYAKAHPVCRRPNGYL